MKRIIRLCREYPPAAASLKWLITGLIILLCGSAFLLLPKGSYIQTEAVVSEVSEKDSSIQIPLLPRAATLHASYLVDDTVYNIVLDGKMSVEPGDIVTIEYKTDEPANFRVREFPVIPVSFLTVGVLMTLISLIFTIKNIRFAAFADTLPMMGAVPIAPIWEQSEQKEAVDAKADEEALFAAIFGKESTSSERKH